MTMQRTPAPLPGLRLCPQAVEGHLALREDTRGSMAVEAGRRSEGITRGRSTTHRGQESALQDLVGRELYAACSQQVIPDIITGD